MEINTRKDFDTYLAMLEGKHTAAINAAQSAREKQVAAEHEFKRAAQEAHDIRTRIDDLRAVAALKD